MRHNSSNVSLEFIRDKVAVSEDDIEAKDGRRAELPVESRSNIHPTIRTCDLFEVYRLDVTLLISFDFRALNRGWTVAQP